LFLLLNFFEGFFCINEDYLIKIGVVKTFDRLPYLNNNLIADIVQSTAKLLVFNGGAIPMSF